MKKVIQLKNVWKTFQVGDSQLHALREVNLDIYKGEFLAILGQSGSGKSTMLNMVGSLDLPSRGKILLDNTDISKLEESQLAQLRGKKIGFIFQQFNLIPNLSSLENVALPLIFQDVPKEKRNKKARDLLKKVGLGERINHDVNKLSGGERQRVAVARALANDPEVILADEPTGNLDTKTGREIMEIFHELRDKEGRTIIMVTHDIGLVKGVDRGCYLQDGKVLKVSKNIKGIRRLGMKK